jgi:hypothetical protein
MRPPPGWLCERCQVFSEHVMSVVVEQEAYLSVLVERRRIYNCIMHASACICIASARIRAYWLESHKLNYFRLLKKKKRKKDEKMKKIYCMTRLT